MRVYVSARRNFGLRPSVSFDVRELQRLSVAPWPVRVVVALTMLVPALIAMAVGVIVLIACIHSMLAG